MFHVFVFSTEGILNQKFMIPDLDKLLQDTCFIGEKPVYKPLLTTFL
jgi:hypothetical protein